MRSIRRGARSALISDGTGLRAGRRGEQHAPVAPGAGDAPGVVCACPGQRQLVCRSRHGEAAPCLDQRQLVRILRRVHMAHCGLEVGPAA